LEIYNEVITDLLRPTSSGLNIRDGDIKRGVYVEDLSETYVVNGGYRPCKRPALWLAQMYVNSCCLVQRQSCLSCASTTTGQ